MPDMVMANCASKLTAQLAGPKDLWSNVPSWSLVSELGTYCLGVTMGNALSCVYWVVGGAHSQLRRSHSPGFTLCGHQGLVLTLAAAAGRAAVCYGTHMADAVGHKGIGVKSPASPNSGEPECTSRLSDMGQQFGVETAPCLGQ